MNCNRKRAKGERLRCSLLTMGKRGGDRQSLMSHSKRHCDVETPQTKTDLQEHPAMSHSLSALSLYTPYAHHVFPPMSVHWHLSITRPTHCLQARGLLLAIPSPPAHVPPLRTNPPLSKAPALTTCCPILLAPPHFFLLRLLISPPHFIPTATHPPTHHHCFLRAASPRWADGHVAAGQQWRSKICKYYRRRGRGLIAAHAADAATHKWRRHAIPRVEK